MTSYLTIQEVAELARVEHKTLRRAIASGALVAFRPGKRWVIREADARAWIESRPSAPVERMRRVQRVSHRSQQTGSVAVLRSMEGR